MNSEHLAIRPRYLKTNFVLIFNSQSLTAHVMLFAYCCMCCERAFFLGVFWNSSLHMWDSEKTSGLSNNGASVAKWLAHLPFTSEAAGSSLSENFLSATRTQSSCEKSKSQRSAESRGFSPGIPVSSHRES